MQPTAAAETLSERECYELLARHEVGRVGVVAEGFPTILPVNYRLIDDGTAVAIVIRTRTGGTIETAKRVALEVDCVDPSSHDGWSVLVRGLLGHLDDAGLGAGALDPHPWVEGRDAWLVVWPVSVTGRRLHARPMHARGGR